MNMYLAVLVSDGYMEGYVSGSAWQCGTLFTEVAVGDLGSFCSGVSRQLCIFHVFQAMSLDRLAELRKRTHGGGLQVPSMGDCVRQNSCFYRVFATFGGRVRLRITLRLSAPI